MAKFKVGDKVKVYYGTKEGKVLSVKEGMRGPIYDVQLGTLHGVPFVSTFAEKELVAANSSACNAPGVDSKRMIAYIKKIVSSINLKAFTGAHGPEIRYNGIPWEYGVALNPYSPEEVVVSAHTWKDAPKDDIKDMEEKVKRDTANLVSKLNASGFSATSRFYYQTKVPIYILGEISAQHKGQNSVQPESASACNTLRPYGSWRAASRGNVHVGDYVIHKAQYASFKDDEEKLDRNSERVAGVQADGFWTAMSGTNELERYSDYYVFNAARACNSTNPIVRKAMNATALNYSPYAKGAWIHDDKGRNYTVVEDEHWGKDGKAVRLVTIRDEATKQTKEVPTPELSYRFHMGEAEACAKCGNSVARNAVGRDKQDAGEVETWVNMFRNFIDWHLPKYNDMEKARKSGEQIIKYVEACLGSEGGKAQLRKMGWTVQKMRETLEKAIASRKGSNAARARNDKQFHTYLVPVLRKGVKDYVTIERVADEETAKKLVDVPSFRIIGVTVDETRPVKVAKNAKALNFSPGDKVSIVDTDIRYGGDKGEVVRKDGFRYVVRLTSRQDKPEVTLQPNQLKAANSEDAQGHEHGDDGKFTSKDGGSDGGDSYEDPKTKRMKERLAKMREKNEALRKDIEARKAGLAQKKADTEKMRAEVMKANVEKWKAGLPKSKNAIVAKALNAATARNADNPHDIDAHGKKLVKGDWVRFLKDMPDVKRGECAVVKYALPGGLIFSTLAGAREISWDASVVEKMPPIPRSLSQIDAWKKGPRA